jgi:structure-specific endonuclease subunit SLX1
MAHLHLLLRSPYFSAWPLEVRFFSADVYRVWEACCQRADALVPDSIEVVVDLKPDVPDEVERPNRAVGTGRLDSLDIGYSDVREHLKKSQFLLCDGERINCQVCRGLLHLKDDLILVCPEQSCRGVFHILCLSSKFLVGEGIDAQMIPAHGKCPTCHSVLKWVTLMRELSLRTWGKTDLEKLLKPRRKYAPAVGRRRHRSPPIRDRDDDHCVENVHIPRATDFICSDERPNADFGHGLSHTDDRKETNGGSEWTSTTTLESDPQPNCQWSVKLKHAKSGNGTVVDEAGWDDVGIVD